MGDVVDYKNDMLARATASVDPRDIFLSPEELARRWRGEVTEKTLANWRSNGGGPHFTRVGGRVVYCLADVRDYERANRARTTSE